MTAAESAAPAPAWPRAALLVWADDVIMLGEDFGLRPTAP